MYEIKAQYGEAKVFAAELDEVSTSQIYGILNHPISENASTAIMPDAHAGAGCVIGYTAKINHMIIPNLIGVDIGCGVLTVELGKIDIDYEELDKFIRANIPSGMKVRDNVSDFLLDEWKNNLEYICKEQDQDLDRVLRSLGTLGGGNHFIEIDEAEDGTKWLTVHSGSRNFGLKVANFHQKIAKGIHARQDKLDYLEGEKASKYLQDMGSAQAYATENRMIMALTINRDFFGNKDIGKRIESVHNYISFDDNVVRKGAISAHKGEEVVIPWNMRDGIIIGVGKGNADWNNSAPHGAGRNFSRTKAKEIFTLKEFQKSMEGIWTSCVHKSTLDESPMAYKDHEVVERLIADTVEVKMKLKPIYNFKAS